jgi:hypothetical protein
LWQTKEARWRLESLFFLGAQQQDFGTATGALGGKKGQARMALELL